MFVGDRQDRRQLVFSVAQRNQHRKIALPNPAPLLVGQTAEDIERHPHRGEIRVDEPRQRGRHRKRLQLSSRVGERGPGLVGDEELRSRMQHAVDFVPEPVRQFVGTGDARSTQKLREDRFGVVGFAEVAPIQLVEPRRPQAKRHHAGDAGCHQQDGTAAGHQSDERFLAVEIHKET